MTTFAVHTRITMGPTAIHVLGELAGKRVFIVTDAFMSTSPYMARVQEHLAGAAHVSMFSGVTPDPDVSVVTAGLSLFMEAKPDVVLAVGGGSPIDAAKAINKMAAEQGTTLPDGAPGAPLGVWVIPTTSGSGSEVTSFAVITNEQDQSKIPLISPDMIPQVAILDPSAVASAPAHLTADSGMDAITHAIEAIVSNQASDLTDALAEKAVAILYANLPTAYSDGGCMPVRERVHNAACMAGMAFENAGLGIVHSLSHAIGGHFGVAHGRINAIVLPHVIAFNAHLEGPDAPSSPSETARRYGRIASILGLSGTTDLVRVRSLMGAITRLNTTLGIPNTLAEAGVPPHELGAKIDEIAEQALHDACTPTNPREVTHADLVGILRAI